MGSRKCCINGCTSTEGQEKDAGVTFHRFPHNPIHVQKWLKASQMDSSFKPTKNNYVCSRHFKRENFTTQVTGKIVLKCLTVPSIFPWNKHTVVVTKTESTSSSKPGSKPPSPEPQEKKDEIDDDKNAVTKVETDKNAEENKTPETNKRKNRNSLKKNSSSKQTFKTPVKPKKVSQRLSAKIEKVKPENPPPVTPERINPTPLVATPKKKNQIVNFVPGSSIETQNFDGKWMPVKVVEVDMNEREVLVRSCDKNNKSKTGINDEWISMDSPRLRPVQPVVTFEVGEKVLARWNDCRKFPATIKRVLDNDAYDVLFDDGYPKIVRGIHINKYSSKNMSKVQKSEPTQLSVLNPLLLNPPSLIPDYIKEMKDIPKAPTEGDWCCVWIDDIPVGQESTFDGPHGKLPTIVVPDWRVKEGWQKHIYLRNNGKWDVLFISPTNRKFRFKNELRIYLAEIGEIYDPEVWDFSLHKKRSKLLGLLITSERFKTVSAQNFKSNQESSNGNIFNNPYATLGALPYVQPNLVVPPPTETEIRVGSLKVKVIDNIYQCPQESCDKTFRKENHLQLHIKHYHEDLVKLMGECLNMEDLAYLRTTVDEQELTPVKPTRKSHGTKSRTKNEMNDSLKEIHIKTENSMPEVKFQSQRSPILEEALKAPIIAGILSSAVKPEKDGEMKEEPTTSNNSSMPLFDPESMIPPHAVSRTGHFRLGPGRKRLRAKYNLKAKKPGPKKRRLEPYKSEKNEMTSSSVQGIIPYHEGPYFKNQASTSYVDENGEVIKIVRMKKEEIINCICGYGEEDGLMIQCELCLCWQHGLCNGYPKSHLVPENYVCLICKNPYRQRSSQKYMHDQEWLYEGKLPIASYHLTNPNQTARFETLKQCHTLIGNLKEMKRFMNSLDVKMNIAEKKGHPKLYLWAKKWEQSPPRPNATVKDSESREDVKRDIKFEESDNEDIKIVPMVPEPELAIESVKCQQTLLDHIQFQQAAVKSRLHAIDAEVTALEEASAGKLNGKTLIDEPKMKQTIFMLLNDLVKMNEIASIHRS